MDWVVLGVRENFKSGCRVGSSLSLEYGIIPPVFEKFYGSIENRTCKKCGEVMPAE